MAKYIIVTDVDLMTVRPVGSNVAQQKVSFKAGDVVEGQLVGDTRSDGAYLVVKTSKGDVNIRIGRGSAIKPYSPSISYGTNTQTNVTSKYKVKQNITLKASGGGIVASSRDVSFKEGDVVDGVLYEDKSGAYITVNISPVEKVAFSVDQLIPVSDSIEQKNTQNAGDLKKSKNASSSIFTVKNIFIGAIAIAAIYGILKVKKII